MNKTIKYTLYGAILVAILYALYNISLQFKRKNDDGTDKEFDWDEFLNQSGKGTLIGGVVGLILGGLKDYELNKIITSFGGMVGYLNEVTYSSENKNKAVLIKANQIQNKLHKKFKNHISEYPRISGSVARGTSINGSDIDITLRFKNHSFSLDNIVDLVNDFFELEYSDSRLMNVRKQGCSVGLVFELYNKKHRIDIVPQREIGNKNGDLFISINNNSFFGTTSRLKTNPTIQMDYLKFTDREKKIIKILKVWKTHNNIPLPSIYLELICKQAFSQINLTHEIDKNVCLVIKYIGNNIMASKIVDPANTNNVLSDKLDYNDKLQTQNACYNLLDDIKINKKYIVDYLPV